MHDEKISEMLSELDKVTEHNFHYFRKHTVMVPSRIEVIKIIKKMVIMVIMIIMMINVIIIMIIMMIIRSWYYVLASQVFSLLVFAMFRLPLLLL